LCGRGDINTYALFAEHDRDLLAPHGYAGLIVPAGIAMDDTTKDYFADLINGQNLASLYHFENEAHIFPSVHNATRFVLLTLTGLATTVQTPTFAAFARQVEHIHDPDRRYTLTADDFTRLNPNTRTFPAFRWRIDAEINRSIYRRVPVLLRTAAADPDADDTEHSAEANPWGLTFKRMLDMANDSALFRTREQLEAAGWKLQGNVFLPEDPAAATLAAKHDPALSAALMRPLYEGKMLWHFDHRFGTYDGQTEAQANKGFLPYLTPEQHADPTLLPHSRYWVADEEVEARLLDSDKPPERRRPWPRGWLLGWRDITVATPKVRTVIAAIVPRTAVGHTFARSPSPPPPLISPRHLIANLSSFVLDYAARQKVGGTHLTYRAHSNNSPSSPPAPTRSPPRGILRRRSPSGSAPACSSSSTPPGISPHSPAITATKAPRSAGTKTAASSSAPSSTPPFFTSTASPPSRSTTSSTPSGSSASATKRPTAPTAPKTPSRPSTSASPKPSPPAPPTNPPSPRPQPTPPSPIPPSPPNSPPT
jgi:hypothetical protein